MKILVYSDYSRINHSVRPEAEIFLQLAARGHEVCIFSPRLDAREPFTGAGIRTRTTGQTRKISPTSIRLLRDELARDRYDIVFATSSRTIPTAAFACLGFDCRLVVYRGTTRGLKRRDPTSFLTVLHPRVDAVVTVSEAVREAVRKKLYRNRDKVVSIFKGHDLDWYTDRPADLSEFGIPPDAIVVIAVARFRPSKGLRYLLEATHLLADIERLHLLVVGSGADQEPYTSLVRSSPMAERIHVTGRRDDALGLIAASDMLVQASVEGEGLPRSILEALAFGKPVISTTAGGAREILEEGKSGFIIPPADREAIARSVRALAEDPAKIRAMAVDCRDLLRSRLSHEKTAASYERFFLSLVGDQVRSGADVSGGQTCRAQISADYISRKAGISQLLEDFRIHGEVLHQKRNTVKKVQLDDADLVVKSFKIPGGVRALLYGRFRKSKARRSFEHAQRLQALGIETPAPVAFVEQYRRGRLRASYFVSEYYPHDFSMSHVLPAAGGGKAPDEAGAVIDAFTRFTFRLHEAGVLHRDYNTGNILVRCQAGDWTFAIIDINRMRFGRLSVRQRLNNLVRLTDDIAAMQRMARTYGQLSHLDPRRCERLLLKLKRQHWRRLDTRKRFKKLLGAHPR